VIGKFVHKSDVDMISRSGVMKFVSIKHFTHQDVDNVKRSRIKRKANYRYAAFWDINSVPLQ